MLRAATSTTTGLPAPESLAAAVPALLKRWRALTFDGRAVVDRSGQRREGLRIVAGRHPYPSARYEAVADGLFPGVGSMQVIDDDAGRVKATFTREGDDTEAELRRPGTPGRLTVRSRTRVAGGWIVAGRVTVAIDTDLAAAAQGHDLELTGTLRYRHVLGWMTLRVGAGVDVSGRREVALTLRLHGRWLARPVVAVVAAVGTRSIRRSAAQDLADAVAAVERILTGDSGGTAADRTPDELAGALFDWLLDQLAVTLPLR